MNRYRTGSEYYAATADQYDELHVHDNDEHYIALRYTSMLLEMLKVKSVLDVGCGTGRGIEHLLRNHPDLRVAGVEPVEELLRIASKKTGLTSARLVGGSGLNLPFADQSFDVVCEFGVLHHVKTPGAVVGEMMRVARRAVILSDENRFAFGSWPARWTKVFLCKAGLFPLFYKLVTRGKGFRYSEGDGIAYSYSVFDSAAALASWGDRLITVGLDRSSVNPGWTPAGTLFQPVLESFHVMLASVRDL